MSVIIRLQNLPWSANSMDIRQFFRGLSIPDGGVNIVGGEKGDAFIAFSTDEDARQAMMKTGQKLKDAPISLLLSSRAEMQTVIEQARARALSMLSGGTAAPPSTPTITMPSVATPSIPLVPPMNTMNPVIPNTAIQPPVISLSGFLASNTAVPTTAVRTNNIIEIPGLSNGYTTSAPSSLLFGNLPNNLPTIVDTTGAERDKIVGKYGIGQRDFDRGSVNVPKSSPPHRDDRQGRRNRRSRSDSSDSSRSRSRDRSSRSPRRRYSRSPDRRRSRSPRSRRYRSRSPRDRYRRSSSRERSYDSDKGKRSPPVSRPTNAPNTNRNFSSIWDVPPTVHHLQQQSNTTPVFQPYTTKSGAGIRSTFSNEQRGMMSNDNQNNFGRDVFGREIRNDRNEEPDACVKVENLSKTTGYGEVRRLFTGLFITNNGIKMINDENGERTGIALIRFAKRQDKMQVLQRDSTMLRDRKLIIRDISDKEYDDAIDSYRPSNSRNLESRSRHGKDENGNPNLSGPPFSCLKVVDLPPFAKEQDIIKIFSSWTIMQIVMGRNAKKIHEAYVKFYREDDAKQALIATPSFRMAHKFVMVSKCTDIEFEVARNEYEITFEDEETVENSNNSNDNNNSNNDTEMEEKRNPSPIPASPVNNFNQNSNNDPRMAIYGQNVMRSPVTRDPRYRNNNENSNGGDNSVQASPMINDYNSDSNQGYNGGTTPSDNMPSSNGNREYQSRDPRRRVDPRVQAQLDNSCYLLLSNVPTHLGEWDIGEWLAESGCNEPTKIILLTNSQRQPNGEAVCEFDRPEQAKKAVTRNNSQLEKNIVRVELITKQRYEEMMNVKSDLPSLLQQSNNLGNKMNENFDLPPNMNNLRNQIPPFMNRPQMNGLGLGPMGMGGPRMGMPPMMGQGNNGRGGPPDMNDSHFNARVLLMENIPYKAGPEEILDYFGPEFDLNPGSIMRRFNDRGQPAGEAKVLFHTPADAKRAFNLRKGNKIMGRTIYLKTQT